MIGRFLGILLVACLTACATPASDVAPQAADTQSAQTLAVAEAFLKAAGMGDANTLRALMADDFVWHNEGDPAVPWIGNWEGPETVMTKFMPLFGAGLKTTSWTTEYSFASGANAVFMGTMAAEATNTGASTGAMSWAVRVQVSGDKVQRWHWFEDSYAVSRAYKNAP